MPAKANEYWGNVKPFRTLDEDTTFEDVNAARRRTCAAQGHEWPEEDGQPCERCGKPSALPAPSLADARYVAERDALIPIAEVAADAHVASLHIADEDLRREAWTRKFHELMTRLAYAGGAAREMGIPVHPRSS